MKLSNKDQIQSYIFTMAVFNFNVHERRILYRIIENCQYALEGQKLRGGFRIDETLLQDKIITCPISLFFKEGEKTHHQAVKEALEGLNSKVIKYEDDEIWKIIRIIERPKFYKNKGIVTFEIQPEIYTALLNFSKGFRKYDIAVVMELESVYAMRFYEMFSYQNGVKEYDIEYLKTIFGLENKYKDSPTNFINRVIKYAKKELDKKSPYSFEYKPKKTGKKFTSIMFFPTKIAKNESVAFEREKAKRMLSPSFVVEKNVVDYLKDNYGFDTKEIKNNIKTLDEAERMFDLMQFLCNKKTHVEGKKNPKGWLINAIKAEIAIKKTNENAK